MNKIIFVIMLLLIPVFSNAEWVRGHMKDTDGDGIKDTYVPGYNRTPADNNPYNNYSTKGNVNPYTGEKGYVDPYQYQQRYNQNYNPYGTQRRYGY